MPNLSSHPIALAGNFYTSSATQDFPLGTKGVSDDGRVFRYAKAGASNLVAGNCIQSPAVVVNHLALTAPVAAAGATSFACTPGATLGTANQYAEGFLSVDTTPGNGYTLGIESHAAFASATAFTLYLRKDDPIQVAWTTSTRIGLLANPYNGVIQMPVTTATGTLVGVASYVITAAQFGWIQTHGPASTLISGTPALGAMVMSPSDAAGAAIILTTTNLVVAQLVGRMAQIGVTAKNNFVTLDIGQ